MIKNSLDLIKLFQFITAYFITSFIYVCMSPKKIADAQSKVTRITVFWLQVEFLLWISQWSIA